VFDRCKLVCVFVKGDDSGGARILEQVGPAARPKVIWSGLKLFALTIIILHNIRDYKGRGG